MVAKKSDEACTGEHHAQYQQYDNYCPIATDISDNEEEDARWDATCESDGETCTNFKYWIIIKEKEESGGGTIRNPLTSRTNHVNRIDRFKRVGKSLFQKLINLP